MEQNDRLRRAMLIGALSSLAWPAARAQSGKTLRLIVPFPPGGSTDILARAVGAKLGPALGQTVVIDNRAGAGGSLGATEVARAEADGNTLLMGHIGTLAVNPALYPKLPYNPLKSFVPVAWVARVPNILVVNASSPIKTLADLVAKARTQPGRMTYSSGGNGSAAHIAVELFKLRTATKIEHVPYRGTAPSVMDLISGQVALTMTGVPPVLEFVRNGRLRALGVSSLKRIDALPDVPTISEAGVKDFEATQWYGLVAPAGTPEQFAARIASERVRWREVVQEARIRPE